MHNLKTKGLYTQLPVAKEKYLYWERYPIYVRFLQYHYTVLITSSFTLLYSRTSILPLPSSQKTLQKQSSLFLATSVSSEFLFIIMNTTRKQAILIHQEEKHCQWLCFQVVFLLILHSPLPFGFIKIFTYGNGFTQCLVDHQLHIKEQGHKILIKSLTTVLSIYHG